MTTPISLPPTVIPPAPTGPAATATQIPGCISFLGTLIIVGAGAELLHGVSPTAAYLFVAVVIMGYLASAGRIDNVTKFFDTVQGIGK